jgi:hypothetical protein
MGGYSFILPSVLNGWSKVVRNLSTAQAAVLGGGDAAESVVIKLL